MIVSVTSVPLSIIPATAVLLGIPATPVDYVCSTYSRPIPCTVQFVDRVCRPTLSCTWTGCEHNNYRTQLVCSTIFNHRGNGRTHTHTNAITETALHVDTKQRLNLRTRVFLPCRNDGTKRAVPEYADALQACIIILQTVP